MWWGALLQSLYAIGGWIAKTAAMIFFEVIVAQVILPFLDMLLGTVPTVEVVPTGGAPTSTLYVEMPDISVFLAFIETIAGTLPLAPFGWYLGLFIIFFTMGNALSAIRFIRRGGG